MNSEEFWDIVHNRIHEEVFTRECRIFIRAKKKYMKDMTNKENRIDMKLKYPCVLGELKMFASMRVISMPELAEMRDFLEDLPDE